MSNFYLMRADEIASYFATVTTSAGTTDADYTDDWICDSRPSRPARAGSGTVTWSATSSSAEVGLIVVGYTNSNVNATIGGGVSTTVTAGALQADGIRLNGFATVTPANQTNLTVAFSGASATVVLGEFLYGKYRSITLPVYTSDVRSDRDFTRDQAADLSSVPPYDPGLAGRTWAGTFILTTAEVEIFRGAFRAQRNGTRPTVVVPDSTVNDAWIGYLSAPAATPISHRHWSVQVTFTELPRVRWA
jgi:hypothetical protein